MRSSILIVDDDRAVLEQLSEILSAEGHYIAFIPRGEFLFPRLSKEDFELILLDVNLPGKNGIEYLKQLKTNHQFAEIPVIMITGDKEIKTLTSCFKNGAHDYVTKPLNPEELKARVQGAIALRHFQKQQLNLEKQKALHSRMMMLSAQMNPHFIFNALNSIQYFIMENDPESAGLYLSEFSQLMRETIENSQQLYISLATEIHYLTRYLSLEKQRFHDQFDFRIEHSVEDPEGTMIPPMLLQPFVENAIVHGLKHKSARGEVLVSIQEIDEAIRCTIRDNGIGRKRAANLRTIKYHRSIGVSNTKMRLELLNSTADSKLFDVVINDLESDGRPVGTEVLIQFPKDLH